MSNETNSVVEASSFYESDTQPQDYRGGTTEDAMGSVDIELSEQSSAQAAQLNLINSIKDMAMTGQGSQGDYNVYTPEEPEVKYFLEYYSNTNVVCYDIVRGMEIYKYIFQGADNEDVRKTALANLEAHFGKPVVPSNDKLTVVDEGRTGYTMPPGFFNSCTDCVTRLYNALMSICLLPRKDITVKDVNYTYSPKHTLFSKQFFSVKIPVRRAYNDVVDWDFVYLIRPNLAIEESSIQLMKSVYGRNSVQMFDDFVQAFTDLLGSATKQVFSLSYYLDMWKRMSHADLCVKGLVNLIRRESYGGYYTDYYKIVQDSRMNHKEASSCIKYNYKGAYQEMTFRNYVTYNNLNLEDIDKLTAFPEKRQDYLKSLSVPELEPLYLYVKHLTNNEHQDLMLMDDYERYEDKRQKMALEVWLYHVRIRINENMFASYLNCMTSGDIVPDIFEEKDWVWGVDVYTDERLRVNRYRPRK